MELGYPFGIFCEGLEMHGRHVLFTLTNLPDQTYQPPSHLNASDATFYPKPSYIDVAVRYLAPHALPPVLAALSNHRMSLLKNWRFHGC